MQIPTYRCNMCGYEWNRESPERAPRMVGLKRSGGKWIEEDVTRAPEHLCYDCFGGVAHLHHEVMREIENERLSRGVRDHNETYHLLSSALTIADRNT